MHLLVLPPPIEINVSASQLIHSWALPCSSTAVLAGLHAAAVGSHRGDLQEAAQDAESNALNELETLSKAFKPVYIGAKHSSSSKSSKLPLLRRQHCSS